MGREHVLAKRRMYLLVQGTSDGHQESPAQVATGAERGRAGPRRQGGRGWAGDPEGDMLGAPQAPIQGHQKAGQGLSCTGRRLGTSVAVALWGELLHEWVGGDQRCCSGPHSAQDGPLQRTIWP